MKSNEELKANSNFLAEVIADSITENGNRLTTMVICFPRIVLSEFNTHRAFSRNSASSRAIPFSRMVNMAKENPFVPLRFLKQHKGMQGYDYHRDADHDKRVEEWLACRDRAVATSQALYNSDVTKQLCNRILEPWMWHTVVVSSTEWENFFALRAHEAAEIHIQRIAELMLGAYNQSSPNFLGTGKWHLPFGDNIDHPRLVNVLAKSLQDEQIKTKDVDIAKVRICVARCARVSYLNFEGKDDYEADLKLCDSLSDQGHWSPFEHVAKAVGDMRLGNFKGFVQYRKMFENENRTDSRVIHVQTG